MVEQNLQYGIFHCFHFAGNQYWWNVEANPLTSAH